jgi:hypothetical protein
VTAIRASPLDAHSQRGLAEIELTDLPPSNTKRTEPALNSSVKLRLARFGFRSVMLTSPPVKVSTSSAQATAGTIYQAHSLGSWRRATTVASGAWTTAVVAARGRDEESAAKCIDEPSESLEPQSHLMSPRASSSHKVEIAILGFTCPAVDAML